MRVVRIFPNLRACLRLAPTLAVEQSEEWLTGRRYLNTEELREHLSLEDWEAGEMILVERQRKDRPWRKLQKLRDLTVGAIALVSLFVT